MEEGIGNILQKLNRDFDLDLNLEKVEKRLDSSNSSFGNSNSIEIDDTTKRYINTFYIDDFDRFAYNENPHGEEK